MQLFLDFNLTIGRFEPDIQPTQPQVLNPNVWLNMFVGISIFQ